MPKINLIEVCIVFVCVVSLMFSFYLQMNDSTLISMVIMILGTLGLKHVMNNDERRKLDRIRGAYARFCQVNGVQPIEPSSILSIADARKAWFCMAHRAGPRDLIEIAMAMKNQYAAYEELESLRSLTYVKAGRLLIWFDSDRLLALLAIFAALVSVLLLVGVSDAEPIYAAFSTQVFPVLVSVAGDLLFLYLAIFLLKPIIPAVLSLLDLVKARGEGPVSDRAIKTYIYSLMRDSD